MNTLLIIIYVVLAILIYLGLGTIIILLWHRHIDNNLKKTVENYEPEPLTKKDKWNTFLAIVFFPIALFSIIYVEYLFRKTKVLK